MSSNGEVGLDHILADNTPVTHPNECEQSVSFSVWKFMQ